MKHLMFAVGLLLTLGASQAVAGTITFVSDTGVAVTSPHLTDGTAETIGVHGLWQPNDPDGSGAKWISYADTGVDGSTLTPTDAVNPGMTIQYALNAAVGSKISFKIWADDTAEITFNNVVVKARNLTQNVCADGSIGCETDEFEQFFLTSVGVNSLKIEVFQVGTGSPASANPFGVLYYGSYSTPDGGATLTLLGSALIGLGALRRKIRR